jgi:hypothetical protein
MRMTSVPKCITSGWPSVSPAGRWSGISRQVPSIQRTNSRALSATFLTSVASSLLASLMGGTMMTSPFCRHVLSCVRACVVGSEGGGEGVPMREPGQGSRGGRCLAPVHRCMLTHGRPTRAP